MKSIDSSPHILGLIDLFPAHWVEVTYDCTLKVGLCIRQKLFGCKHSLGVGPYINGSLINLILLTYQSMAVDKWF